MVVRQGREVLRIDTEDGRDGAEGSRGLSSRQDCEEERERKRGSPHGIVAANSCWPSSPSPPTLEPSFVWCGHAYPRSKVNTSVVEDAVVW